MENTLEKAHIVFISAAIITLMGIQNYIQQIIMSIVCFSFTNQKHVEAGKAGSSLDKQYHRVDNQLL